MTPDDPRHGTHRGYVIGCRCRACKDGHAKYANLWRMGRVLKTRDATGTHRRIRALMALGWTADEIVRAAGGEVTRSRLTGLLRSEAVTGRNAVLIERVYDELSMSLPPDTWMAGRNRRRAARKGWLPPLAWDDIDNDPEPPAATDEAVVDEVAIARRMAGDKTTPLTKAERVEVVRRWLASGRPTVAGERTTGLKFDRYRTTPTEAAA